MTGVCGIYDIEMHVYVVYRNKTNLYMCSVPIENRVQFWNRVTGSRTGCPIWELANLIPSRSRSLIDLVIQCLINLRPVHTGHESGSNAERNQFCCIHIGKTQSGFNLTQIRPGSTWIHLWRWIETRSNPDSLNLAWVKLLFTGNPGSLIWKHGLIDDGCSLKRWSSENAHEGLRTCKRPKSAWCCRDK